MGTGDLNSGTHAYTLNTLLTEPSYVSTNFPAPPTPHQASFYTFMSSSSMLQGMVEDIHVSSVYHSAFIGYRMSHCINPM